MGKTTLIPLLIFTLYLGFVIGLQYSTFTISHSLAEYEYRYGQSQYVLGDRHTLQMGDGDIYTYAGIRYVQGEDPTKINFEHTPLIKYFFGASYLLFGNPNWVIIPLSFLAFFSFWYLTGQLLSTLWSRWLATVFFLGHTTIIKAIPQTMLDFPMTSFLLATTAVLCFFVKKQAFSTSLLFGLLSGLMLVCKYPLPLLAMYLGLIYLWLISHKTPIKYLLYSGLFTIGVYFLTYTSYFLHGASLIDFAKFEWWRWQWFQGKTDSQKFMLLSTIFFGRYPKWWDSSGGYITVPHWNLYWPISVILYLTSFINVKKMIHHPLFPYQLWIVISLGVYMLGAAEDRFLIPLIPGFALFGAYVIESNLLKLKIVR